MPIVTSSLTLNVSRAAHAKMTETNHHVVTSATDFQALMSADLDRVVVINFWAPWAEPCARMNAFIGSLLKKHPHVLFLQVEAEEQSDITESFDIQSVPAFVILKGHTLLERITGADHTKLAELVEKHGRIVKKPLSHTDKPPAKAPAGKAPSGISSEENPTETKEELNARLRRLMDQDKVVLFMKGSPDAPRCGFSRKIVALLREQSVEFKHFDILTDESVRQGLKDLNDWPTFPQLIIKGELVGGLDITQEMASNGELEELLKS